MTDITTVTKGAGLSEVSIVAEQTFLWMGSRLVWTITLHRQILDTDLKSCRAVPAEKHGPRLTAMSR